MPGSIRGTFAWKNIKTATKIDHKIFIEVLVRFLDNNQNQVKFSHQQFGIVLF